MGSNQRVKVKSRFQPKAKKAYNRCNEAIDSEDDYLAARKWREIFGTSMPLAAKAKNSSFNDTEEFIEDLYSVDITDTLNIDCEVTQDGWRPTKLREMLRTKAPLRAGKKLKFWVTGCSVAEPYTLKWKVLNRGPEAQRRNMIRGGIINSTKPETRIEHSNFRGNHIVECYAIKDEVVVARDRIDVPITTNGS